MNERVPEDYELFPTEVDARIAAAHFNARNGSGRRAAAVSQHARGWVVVICQYTPVGYLSQVESESAHSNTLPAQLFEKMESIFFGRRPGVRNIALELNYFATSNKSLMRNCELTTYFA